MKKNSLRCIALCLGIMASLAACGNSIPDMTAEELNSVGEYAANALLKYDANNRSRLVDLSLIATPEPTPEPTPTPTPENQGMGPVDDTPVINNSQADGENRAGSMEALMALPEGVSVAYQGMELADSYSSNGGSGHFALDASAGTKLLVLKFFITNGSQTEQAINLLDKNITYRVTVNNDYTKNSLVTLLLNDMGTYIGNIPAGEQRETVLLIEVSESIAENITAITLNMKNEQQTYTIQLQ